MDTRSKICQVFLFICFFLPALLVQAQQRFDLAQGAELKIAGTSSLRDWTMVSNMAKGQATILMRNNKVLDIKNLVVSMPARSLKSGNVQMDNHAYKSLNPQAHPEIRFELSAIELITDSTLRATGLMTIAGVTKQQTVLAHYSVSPVGVQFTGQTALRFSDFEIDPPTALMGTVKTGDPLTLSFNLVFNNQNL